MCMCACVYIRECYVIFQSYYYLDVYHSIPRHIWTRNSRGRITWISRDTTRPPLKTSTMCHYYIIADKSTFYYVYYIMYRVQFTYSISRTLYSVQWTYNIVLIALYIIYNYWICKSDSYIYYNIYLYEYLLRICTQTLVIIIRFTPMIT